MTLINARLFEMLVPMPEHLVHFPEMIQPLTDRLREFLNGWPMMVSQMPTQDGRIVLRIETQDPKQPKNKSITYVWPRPNLENE